MTKRLEAAQRAPRKERSLARPINEPLHENTFLRIRLRNIFFLFLCVLSNPHLIHAGGPGRGFLSGEVVSCDSSGQLEILIFEESIQRWLNSEDESALPELETLTLTDSKGVSYSLLLLSNNSTFIDQVETILIHQSNLSPLVSNGRNILATTATLRHHIPILMVEDSTSKKIDEGVMTTVEDTCTGEKYSSIETFNPTLQTVFHEWQHLGFSPEACYLAFKTGQLRNYDALKQISTLNESNATLQTMLFAGPDQAEFYDFLLDPQPLIDLWTQNNQLPATLSIFDSPAWMDRAADGPSLYAYGPFFYFLKKYMQGDISLTLAKVLTDTNESCLKGELEGSLSTLWHDVEQQGVDIERSHNLFFDLLHGPFTPEELAGFGLNISPQATSGEIFAEINLIQDFKLKNMLWDNQLITIHPAWSDPVFTHLREKF